MSSPKDKDYENGKIKKNNLTTIYMKSKEKLYGTLRFNCMIPVPESELSAYKINDEGDFSYKYSIRSDNGQLFYSCEGLILASSIPPSVASSKIDRLVNF